MGHWLEGETLLEKKQNTYPQTSACLGMCFGTLGYDLWLMALQCGHWCCNGCLPVWAHERMIVTGAIELVSGDVVWVHTPAMPTNLFGVNNWV